MSSILQTIKLKSRQVKQFVKFIVVSGRGNTHVQTFLASTLFHLDQTPAALPQNSLLPGSSTILLLEPHLMTLSSCLSGKAECTPGMQKWNPYWPWVLVYSMSVTTVAGSVMAVFLPPSWSVSSRCHSGLGYLLGK